MNSQERKKPAIFALLSFSLIAMLLSILGIAVWRQWNNAEPGLVSELILPENKTEQSGDVQDFKRAVGTQPMLFPADFGAHPDYQTEWWYYTGNLSNAAGNHFGYQLTFFRRALVPAGQRSARASAWAADQAYMAHFALTDVTENRHHYFERLSRGAAGLAGAQGEDYRVWLEDWFVEQTAPQTYHLYANRDGVRIDLVLRDEKGPILHGENGYSQKGPDPGNASYYYSQTHLDTKGTVSIGEKSFTVHGLSWKDHEYSTSALSEGQIGWDWFSIQLDDQNELMVFQIRRADGTTDAFSSGTLITPNGDTRHLNRDDFQIDVLDTWKSPETGAVYPSRWVISIPSEDLHLEILPYSADQEMKLSYNYWEGAVSISGRHAGQEVHGAGYVEMTGYAGSMSGEF